MQDTKLNVMLNDQEITIDVIDILENQSDNKQYIIYNIDGNEKDIYMSILDEKEDSYTLTAIESKEEARLIEEYLQSLVKEENN